MNNFLYYQHMRNLAIQGEPRALLILNNPRNDPKDKDSFNVVYALALYGMAMYEAETHTNIIEDKETFKSTLDAHSKKIGQYVRALTFMWLSGIFVPSKEFPYTLEDVRKMAESGGAV